MHDVPLERTVSAGQWLKGTREVEGSKLGLFGWSRGAEQAVLLGSLLSRPDPFSAIAAHAPSDTVVAGFDMQAMSTIEDVDPATGQKIWGAAWTWQQGPPGGLTLGVHEVFPLGPERTLVRQRIDQRGPIGTLVGVLMRGMTRRYLALEAEGLKARCERQVAPPT